MFALGSFLDCGCLLLAGHEADWWKDSMLSSLNINGLWDGQCQMMNVVRTRTVGEQTPPTPHTAPRTHFEETPARTLHSRDTPPPHTPSLQQGIFTHTHTPLPPPTARQVPVGSAIVAVQKDGRDMVCLPPHLPPPPPHHTFPSRAHPRCPRPPPLHCPTCPHPPCTPAFWDIVVGHGTFMGAGRNVSRHGYALPLGPPPPPGRLLLVTEPFMARHGARIAFDWFAHIASWAGASPPPLLPASRLGRRTALPATTRLPPLLPVPLHCHLPTFAYLSTPPSFGGPFPHVDGLVLASRAPAATKPYLFYLYTLQ